MSVYKKHGSKYWLYDFQRGGERFTGSTGQTTKTEAERVERAEIAAVEAGRGQDVASKMTLAMACDRYYIEVGQGRKSWKDTQRSLELLCFCITPTTKLKDITAVTITEAIRLRRLIPTKRGDGQVKNSSINRQIIEPLKTILNRARNIWGAQNLPYIEWKKLTLREPKAKKVSIDEDSDKNLHEALQPHWQVFRDFILTYGPRLSEMFFHPSRVSKGSDGVVRILLRERKGDDDHIIPLDDEDGRAMLARKSRAEAAGFDTVWTYEKKGVLRPCTYSGAKSAFRRAKEKSGASFTAHDHRHQAGQEMTRSMGIRVAQELLGHTDIKTTQRYSHVLDNDLLKGISDTKSRKKSRSQDNK